MAESRRSSQGSQKSLLSFRSVGSPGSEIFNPLEEIPDGPTHQRDNSGGSRNRVHFGSDLRYEYGNVSTEDDTDADPAQTGDTQHNDYRSVDITEVPRRRPSEARKRKSLSETDVELQEKGSSAGLDRPGPNDSVFHHLGNFGHSMLDKTRRLATRLGRPLADNPSGVLDLEFDPSAYHPEWESGNNQERGSENQLHTSSSSEAHRLVRELTHEHDQCSGGQKLKNIQRRDTKPGPTLESGLHDRGPDSGVLSQLLKLHGGLEPPHPPRPPHHSHTNSWSSSEPNTPVNHYVTGTSPGSTTPKKEKVRWYKKSQNMSSSTLNGRRGSSFSGASTPVASEVFSAASKRRSQHPERSHDVRLEDEIEVTLHIAEILARQKYIMQLCRTFMMFGAPTHRLEEYMQMTAKVLEVQSQYLYVPGCMIMSFDDVTTRTTEVKLVRVAQGVDLGRLADTHNVYKNVIHDVIGVEEATLELENIMKSKPRFNKVVIVLTYGLATAMVGPFAFNARPIDLPIIFFNGTLLGILQHVIAPRSVLYSNVFEVTAAVLTSFIARGLGSIPLRWVNGKEGQLFCFSAIAQSSIALILPGYTVLCSSLELQSHQIVAGSIRMVYAIIYSLFLGYGITVGTTIYGLIDPDATSSVTCPNQAAWKNEYIQRFPFVAMFAFCLLVINQGKWKQTPIMVTIAMAGYVTNYFVTKRLGSSSPVSNTVGAFTIGVIGNLYSRLWHGHAATAILPGIFVLVPSGLAATGSLISGVNSADEIRGNLTSSNSSDSSTYSQGMQSYQENFDLGYGMVQVAIGITVGLFIAALVIYPFGKRRSGLFSF